MCARKEIFFLETSLFFFSKFESLSRVNGGLDGWKSAISPTNRAGKTALCSNVEKKSPLFVRSRAYNKRRARSNFEQIYMTWFFFFPISWGRRHTVIFFSFARVTTSKRVISRDARSRSYLALIQEEIFLPFNSFDSSARSVRERVQINARVRA